jgi:HAD superfamily hydrolase (TIGR01509 family)
MVALASKWNAVAAVCFDLDGTLVDSESESADAIALALEPLFRPLSPAERNFIVGHGFGEIYRYIYNNGGIPWDIQMFEAQVYAARVALFAKHGPGELPGARALVRFVAQRRPCALVTGSTRPEAELVLTGLALTDCFQTTICAGDYRHGKPDPEPYLRAAKALGIPPTSCLAIEDSTAGIAAARAAGMCCIAVRAGNRYGQDQSGASHVMGSLAEILTLLKDAGV